MYESYPWPGACSLKTEIKIIIKNIKSFFDFFNNKRAKLKPLPLLKLNS